jgi:uncharacterized damage-inducible protein DinB
MSLNQSLLPEFDNEMASTHKSLERVPDEKLNWKPHQKSYTMGELATHIANLPTWANITINEDVFDMAPPGQKPPVREPISSAAGILALFDNKVKTARAAIEGASDDQLLKPWTLRNAGKTVFSMPRIAVLRSFVMNHIIHHRAQLGIYLRLNDIPVPFIYGPTADESA